MHVNMQYNAEIVGFFRWIHILKFQQDVLLVVKNAEYIEHVLNHYKLLNKLAYHASRQPQVPHAITLNALLPLFYESVHTVAMVKHGTDVTQKATQYVTPVRS